MKKIIFYLSIVLVLAIFSLSFVCPPNIGLQQGVSAAQAEQVCAADNAIPLFDVCFEDFFDDESSESEKKKIVSTLATHYQYSFVATAFAVGNFKKIISTKRPFPFRIAIFLFICVFRI